jgi:hypothetical protein
MKKIWYIQNANGTVSFYEGMSCGLHLHAGTYTNRKANFAYPTFIYEWIEIPCAE